MSESPAAKAAGQTVDTRIVEAKFDSEDFEKGVDKTVKKLDELKKSLNLTDAGKSVTEFAKSTSESVEKTDKSLEKLTNRLTTFTGQIKNQLISGLANEVSSVFMRIEQSIMSLTTGGLQTGLSKYTEILTAVRTMTAAGKSEEESYKAIERLGKYSDQTSYSLSQMSSGMSKLVAAGSKLDTAEKSMEGLANMAAVAGVNIYDANRAFTNFTQAYSSGTMRIQDWMSFESLNMATEGNMKAFMKAAETIGTLKATKDSKGNVVYKTAKTKTGQGKKVTTGKQVATEGFRDTLKYGWLTREVMEEATAVLSYFDELEMDADQIKAILDGNGDDWEKWAAKAYQAAKEARSFADVIGTLKDVLATGWATTYEHIFGPLKEATEFFTFLADSNFANIFYNLSTFRNDILEVWAAVDKSEGGRAALRETLMNIDEAIGLVGKAIDKFIPSAEGIGNWLKQQTIYMKEASEDFLTWMKSTQEGGGMTGAERVAEMFRVLGEGIKLFGKVIGVAWKVVKTVIDNIFPSFETIEGIFNSLENAIVNVDKILSPVIQKMGPLFDILGIVVSFVSDMAIGTFQMNIQLFSDALGLLIEILGGDSAQMEKGAGILDGIKKTITDIGDACKSAIKFVGDFFDVLFNGEKQNAKEVDENGNVKFAEVRVGGLFNRLESFFRNNEFVQNVKAWLDQAVIDVGTFIKELPDKIAKFIGNGKTVLESFWQGLFYKEREGISGNTDDFVVETPLKKWLDKAVLTAKDFIKNIPSYVTSAIQYTGNVIRTLISALFGREDGEAVTATDILAELKKPFENLSLATVIDEIKKIGKEIFNQVMSIFTGSTDLEENKKTFSESIAEGIKWIKEKADGAWTTVSEWFIKLPDKIVDFFTGDDAKQKAGEAGPIESAIREFAGMVGDHIKKIPDHLFDAFDSAINGIDNLWNSVYSSLTGSGPNTGKKDRTDGMKNAVQESLFIRKQVGSLADEFITDMTHKTGKGKEDVAKPTFFELFIERLGESIKNAFAKIPTWIAEGLDIALKGIDAALVWLGVAMSKDTEQTADDQSGLGQAIKNIGDSLYKLITETVPSTLKTAWEWVGSKAAGWYSAIEKVLNDNGINWDTIKTEAQKIGMKIGDFVNDIPKYIKIGFNFFDLLWNGQKSYRFDPRDEVYYLEREGGLKKALAPIGESLKNTFIEFGPKILDGINSALQWVGEQINFVTGLLGKEPAEGEEGLSLWDRIKKAVEGDKEKSAFVNSIEQLGLTIKNIIVEVIPNFIKAAFQEIATKVPEFISSIFGGGEVKEVAEAEKEYEEVYNMFTGQMEKVEKNQPNINPEKENNWVTNILNSLSFVRSAVAEEVAEDGDATKDAKSITSSFDLLGLLANKIGELGSGDTGKLLAGAALIYAIAYALEEFTGMFELTDEIYAVTHGIAWAGIGLALAGLGIVITKMAFLVDDTEKSAEIIGKDGSVTKVTKFDKLLSAFTSFGEFFTKLANSIAIIAGIWQGGQLLNTIADIVEDVKTAGMSSVAKGAIGAGVSLTGGFGIGVLISSALLSFIGDVGPAAEAMAVGISDFTAVINPAIHSLAELADDIPKAIDLAKGLHELLSGFWTAVLDFSADLAGDEETKEGLTHKSFEEYSEPYVDYILAMSTFMSSISKGLKDFSEIENPTAILDDFTKNFIHTNVFSEFLRRVGFSLKDWVLKPYGKDTVEEMSLGMQMLGSIMDIFGTNIANLKLPNVLALMKTLDVFEKLANVFETTDHNSLKEIAQGTSFIGDFAKQVRTFGYNIKIFINYLNEITADVNDEAVYASIIKKIDASAYIIKTLIEALKEGKQFWDFEDYTNSISGLNTVLPDLGTAISTFVNSLNDAISSDISLDRITILSTAVGMLADVATAAASLRMVDTSSIVDKLVEFMDAISGYEEIKENAMDKKFTYYGMDTKFRDAITRMTEAINSAIEEGLNLEPTITPIIDPTEMNKVWDAYFGSHPNINFNPGTEPVQQANPENTSSTLEPAGLVDLSGIIQRMDSINSALNSPITDIGVWLNSGTLVGHLTPGIRAELTRLGALGNRGNS